MIELDPYRTLGVAKDAREADIRRAYKRLARELHPDREGGSHDAMAAVNQSYAVLSDSQRRAHYDRFGQVNEPPSFEATVNQFVLSVFAMAVNGDGNTAEILSRCVQAIDKQFEENRAKRRTTEKHRAKIERLRGKVSAAKANLFEQLLDAQLSSLPRALAELDEHDKVLTAARLVVLEHASNESLPQTGVRRTGASDFQVFTSG